YTKFLLEQKITESHRFVERMRSEVATSRDCIAQLNVVVAELDGLNEVIDDALEEIEKLETNVDILEGVADVGKKRRLIAELEAEGEVDGAAKCLEHMKVVVARDAVTLGDLETVWARCQVGKSLKAGFVADMEV
ncbi:hypothetical protein Tco_1249267, partial [Tanacetum coccineum]